MIRDKIGDLRSDMVLFKEKVSLVEQYYDPNSPEDIEMKEFVCYQIRSSVKDGVENVLNIGPNTEWLLASLENVKELEQIKLSISIDRLLLLFNSNKSAFKGSKIKLLELKNTTDIFDNEFKIKNEYEELVDYLYENIESISLSGFIPRNYAYETQGFHLKDSLRYEHIEKFLGNFKKLESLGLDITDPLFGQNSDLIYSEDYLINILNLENLVGLKHLRISSEHRIIIPELIFENLHDLESLELMSETGYISSLENEYVSITQRTIWPAKLKIFSTNNVSHDESFCRSIVPNRPESGEQKILVYNMRDASLVGFLYSILDEVNINTEMPLSKIESLECYDYLEIYDSNGVKNSVKNLQAHLPNIEGLDKSEIDFCSGDILALLRLERESIIKDQKYTFAFNMSDSDFECNVDNVAIDYMSKNMDKCSELRISIKTEDAVDLLKKLKEKDIPEIDNKKITVIILNDADISLVRNLIEDNEDLKFLNVDISLLFSDDTMQITEKNVEFVKLITEYQNIIVFDDADLGEIIMQDIYGEGMEELPFRIIANNIRLNKHTGSLRYEITSLPDPNIEVLQHNSCIKEVIFKETEIETQEDMNRLIEILETPFFSQLDNIILTEIYFGEDVEVPEFIGKIPVMNRNPQ